MVNTFHVTLPNGKECKVILNETLEGVANRYGDGSSEITIDTRVRGRKKLETAIHEMLHQLNWRWPEEKVTEQAEVLSNVLWKMGYRVVKQQKKRSKSKPKKKRKR